MCTHCNNDGFIESPMASGRWIICPCRKLAKTREILQDAQIPPMFEGCTLENWELPKEGAQRAADVLIQLGKFGRQWRDLERRGLILQGGTGIGKTHLGVAVLKRLAENRVSVMFQDAQELLSKLRRSFDGKSETSGAIMDELDAADVLLLDDLGAHQVTDWTDETWTAIINRRYSYCKGLIITTNLSVQTVAKSPAMSIEKLVDARAYSRLMGMCDQVRLTGEDHRLRRGAIQ